jgi:hypothetical protein
VSAIITIRPVAPGRESELREFVATLRTERRVDWAESQRRLGTRKHSFTMTEGEPTLVVMYAEAADPTEADRRLASSDHPFDVWYRERLDSLLEAPLPAETLLDPSPPPGPWRGFRLRRWR